MDAHSAQVRGIKILSSEHPVLKLDPAQLVCLIDEN